MSVTSTLYCVVWGKPPSFTVSWLTDLGPDTMPTWFNRTESLSSKYSLTSEVGQAKCQKRKGEKRKYSSASCLFFFILKMNDFFFLLKKRNLCLLLN